MLVVLAQLEVLSCKVNLVTWFGRAAGILVFPPPVCACTYHYRLAS
jgi:hypothetical protein